jgi:hypothetical protein
MIPAHESGSRVGCTDSERKVSEVIPFLVPDLKATLASLADAPAAVAQATVQLLPFGSRLSLKTLGLAVWNDGSDDDKLSSLILTPFAFEVAAVLAAEAEHDASSFTDWTERARQAMEDLQAGRG